MAKSTLINEKVASSMCCLLSSVGLYLQAKSLGFSSNSLRKAVHPTILMPASMKQGRAGIAVELLSHAFPTWQSLLGVK